MFDVENDELEVEILLDSDDVELEDDEEDEPPYGQAGSFENPTTPIKWVADGAETLAEVAQRVRGLADYFDSLGKTGWELSQPVDNGFVMTEWKGEGAPPDKDRESV